MGLFLPRFGTVAGLRERFNGIHWSADTRQRDRVLGSGGNLWTNEVALRGQCGGGMKAPDIIGGRSDVRDT